MPRGWFHPSLDKHDRRKFRDHDGEEGVSEPHGGISLNLSLEFQQVCSKGGEKGMLSTFQLWQEPGFASEEVREIAPGCAQAWKAGKKSYLTALASGDVESSSAVPTDQQPRPSRLCTLVSPSAKWSVYTGCLLSKG